MKLNLFLTAVLSIAFLASCDNTETVIIESEASNEVAKDTLFHYELQTDIQKPSNDDGATTRATSTGEWEDGDQLYFEFSTSSGKKYATGSYNAVSRTWSLSSATPIPSDYGKTCSVYYYEGVNPKTTDTKISYDHVKTFYSTTAGTYSADLGLVNVSAKLEATGWRMRFKGKVGDQIDISISRASLYNQRDKSTNKLTLDNQDAYSKLTVNNDGYTDYVVASFPSGSYNTTFHLFLRNQTTGTFYHRLVNKDKIQTGKSYYFSVPSASDAKGWTSNNPTGTITGHGYIDLGLSSGRKWATCNIGAANQEDVGNYYAWGETETKDTYTSSNYTYNQNSNLSEENDAAYVNWGNSWKMPSQADVEELTKNCLCEKHTLFGKNVYSYIGPNGKIISIPCGGHKNNTSYYDTGYNYCWTSTYSSSSYAYRINGTSYSSTGYRYYGMPIRPVLAN